MSEAPVRGPFWMFSGVPTTVKYLLVESDGQGNTLSTLAIDEGAVGGTRWCDPWSVYGPKLAMILLCADEHGWRVVASEQRTVGALWWKRTLRTTWLARVKP